MRIQQMSNNELLSSLRSLVAEERRLVTNVVVYLVEVEARRLHLELGCSSMFDFCTRKLGLSEGEAYRRLTVARLVARFPSLLEALASRHLHLSNLVLLKDLFTAANVDDLTAAASGKSKREVQQLVATLAPKPDAAPLIRKLPPRVTPANPAVMANPAVVANPAAPATLPSTTAPSATSTSTASLAQQQQQPHQLLPLAEGRHRVQLTASTALREKLEHARALMRHRNPSGDLAVIIEAALDLLVAKLENQRLGTTSRPQKEKDNDKAVPEEKRVVAASPHITRATRRAVTARDGGQCAYVSADGERCPSRDFLELDHKHPRARGGKGEATNIRLLCRAHNRFAAECLFGKEHVAEQIYLRQRKRGVEEASAGARSPETPPTT